MTEIQINPYENISNKKLGDSILILKKDIFKGVILQQGKSIFTFVNCDFTNLKIEVGEEVFFDVFISFSGCIIEKIEIEKIEIEKILSENISISFHACIISGRFSAPRLQTVLLNNCVIMGSIFFLDLNSINISLTGENIFSRIWKNLIMRYGKNNFDILIKSSQAYHANNASNFTFSASNFDDGDRKKKIEIKDYETLKDYRLIYNLSEKEKNEFKIQVNLHFGDKSLQETKVSGAQLHSLALSGKSQGKFEIENCKIDNIYIHQFSVTDSFILYNIKPINNSGNQKIEIYKSNLTNSWIDNIDFRKYTLISFFRTRFSDTIFTSCNFPSTSIDFDKFKNLPNVHYPEKTSENFYKDQYETFLQLRNVFEKSGNTYESQKFQAISYEALKKIEDVSLWDKVILSLNSISNNHGLSIARPFWLLILVTIPTYILYLMSINRIFTNQEFDSSLIGYYFSFLDITHKLDFLAEKEEFTAFSLTIDFMNKLFVGYLVYQFIAAFRKYGKK